MRRWSLAGLVVVAAGCGELDAPPGAPDEDPDASQPSDQEVTEAAVDGCAVAPTGDWYGVIDPARRASRWRRATTRGCVDRYLGDAGALVLDRRRAPARFALTTDGLEVTGWFEGRGFGGALAQAGTRVGWRFVPVDAALATEDRCASPPVGGWQSTSEGADGSVAVVTWRLVEVAGCRDRYQPDGTVTTARGDAHPIARGDGMLELDRAAAPRRFRMIGVTTWTAPGAAAPVVARWSDDLEGVLDGGQGGAVVDGPGGRQAWAFARLP